MNSDEVSGKPLEHARKALKPLILEYSSSTPQYKHILNFKSLLARAFMNIPLGDSPQKWAPYFQWTSRLRPVVAGFMTVVMHLLSLWLF
jgi:hypothetical protein